MVENLTSIRTVPVQVRLSMGAFSLAGLHPQKAARMSRTNVAIPFTEKTHEGAPASRMTPEQALRRSVLSCLLWENEFYEDGQTIADRIVALAKEVSLDALARLAVEARSGFHLRHVPLLLCSVLADRAAGKPHCAGMVQYTLADCIGRADEIAEFLAIYGKLNTIPPDKIKSKLRAQVKRGLARAFQKFDRYQITKWNRDGAIKMRDALFLSHAKPRDDEQAAVFKELAEKNLAAPETWEHQLMVGGDKKATFEGLIREGKLGYFALLRNLRNMSQAGCDEGLVRHAIRARRGGAHKVLPFRFIAAAKAAPKFEEDLDIAMCAGLQQQPKLPGKTIVIIDVSGSMNAALSAKSDMTRMLAGAALGAVARELCEESAIYATGGNDAQRVHKTALVPPRHGMALVDAVAAMQMPLGGGGIFLKQAVDYVREAEKTADRIIVITDEQDCGIAADDRPDAARPFGRTNYIMNVASAKNGIGYGKWTHISGMSEAVFTYIQESERHADNA
jgi:60 kDa SS-A/Ro ribonucleoprotein